MLQVKVWFQNRRMKHKRQTLSKSGDDEDSKEGGVPSGRSKADEKKSCQGCDLPSDLPGLGLPLNNNNNSSFNNNSSNASSGASSVASSLSQAQEEDSRSHDGSVTPRAKASAATTAGSAASDVSVKVEAGIQSPPCLTARTPIQGLGPGPGPGGQPSKEGPGEVVKPPRGSGGSLTPSLPGTPLGTPLGTPHAAPQQASPQGGPGAPGAIPQGASVGPGYLQPRPRSSPGGSQGPASGAPAGTRFPGPAAMFQVSVPS